jgi:arylsulfatase A-like enzyme
LTFVVSPSTEPPMPPELQDTVAPAPIASSAPAKSNNSLGRTLLAALSIAIIGSAEIAIAEAIATGVNSGNKLLGEPFPYHVAWWGLGKFALTHLLLWTPTMLLLAVLFWIPLRRRPHTPEPWLWGAFVLIAALVVIPADLALANKFWISTRWMIAAGGGLILAAIAVWKVSWLRRKIGVRGYGRLRGGLTVVFALLIAASGMATANSPWMNPTRYRVTFDDTPREPSARPNVLWIVIDTARADHLGPWGSKGTTPFLDEFAQNAIVFDRCISDGIWTMPSHASMFTGLSVRQHGASSPRKFLPPRHRTIADLLTENGYDTACFANNPLVTRRTNLAQGFETAHAMRYFRYLGRFSLESIIEDAGWAPPVSWLDGDYGAAMTNQLVADWLGAREYADEPFFLFINYMEAHLPYQVPTAFRARDLNPEEVERSHDFRSNAFGSLVTAMNLRYNTEEPTFISEKDQDILARQYHSTLRYLDLRVREIIEMVEAMGLLDHTLVIITADHGEHLGQHELWSHMMHTYNDTTHVPLIIRDPSMAGARRVDAPVQLSDLYHTVANAALDRDAPGPSANSIDLLQLARGSTDAHQRHAITRHTGPDPTVMKLLKKKSGPKFRHREFGQTAVVGSRYKLIASDDGMRELYDIQRDPGELRDLSTRFPEKVAELESYLADWTRRTPEYIAPTGMDSQQANPKLLEALRGLGYIGD